MSEPLPSLNILLIDAANKVTIARRFIESANKRGLNVRLFSYEQSIDVPISAIASVIVGRRLDDIRVFQHLRDLADGYHINMIVPFSEKANKVASEFIDRYNDVFAPVSSPAQADDLIDKVELTLKLIEANIPVPEVYESGRPIFPLIARPRYNRGSSEALIIDNVPDFRRILKLRNDYFLQRYINEADFYTVDCYSTRQGQVICSSPRHDLDRRGDYVLSTVTVESMELNELATDVAECLRLRGAYNIQFLYDKGQDCFLVVDVILHLDDGVTATMAAGADIPGMIIDEAMEQIPKASEDVQVGVKVVRYLEDIILGK